MKALLTFLLCLITLTAIGQMSPNQWNDYLRKQNKSLDTENEALKREIALYKKLANEQDALIKLLNPEFKGKNPPINKSHYYIRTGRDCYFDKNVYIKGKLFIIEGKDTVEVVLIRKPLFEPSPYTFDEIVPDGIMIH